MTKRLLTTQTIVNLPSDPVSGTDGEIYYNTTSNNLRLYSDGQWIDVVSVSSGSLLNTDVIAYPDYISFDTTPETSSTSPGTLYWSEGEGTFVAQLKGGNIDLDIGQENVVLCYNGSGSAMTVGQVVYISGAQGQRPSITLSDASTDPTSKKSLGFVSEAIANGSEGFVTTFGVIKGVDTFGFTEGGAIYLSTTTGEYTQTNPTQPDHSVFLGYCLKASQTAGRIFVNPQNGYEIEELHNVLITSVQDGQYLAYSSASSLWTNQDLEVDFTPQLLMGGM